MTARPLRRALVPLVVVVAVIALALAPAGAAADPPPPADDGSVTQTPTAEPVPPAPTTLPTVPEPVSPDVRGVLEPVPPPTDAPPVLEPLPEPEPVPEPVPVPEPILLPPPPVVVPPPPGRAVGCDAVTAPVPREVTVVASGIRVHPCLASRVDALVALAAHSGLVLTGGGWRSHQRQIELRRAHCGTSHYAIWEMPSGRCRPPTARPGRSRHERGLAVDFNNCSTRVTICWLWLNHHAPAYGLYNLPSEPWHWSVDGH